MDLNVNALISATYLIPIAITLRKIYAPSFETPAAIAAAVDRLDARNRHGQGIRTAETAFY